MTNTRATVPTLEDMAETIGFPYRVMPSGWFQVGWSHQMGPGDVRPLRYFKQHQVLYRTDSGEAVVLTAFCPHFGAHLGHGGRVEGDSIVCPFHGWSWGTDGYNVRVPATGEKSRARRRIRKWPVAESNGIIWVWHDALARPPLWQPPPERRPDHDFLPVSEHTTYLAEKVRARPQYTMENVVDIDHLIFVHGSTLLPEERSPSELPELVDEGPCLQVNYPAPNTLNELNGVGVIRVDFQEDGERPWRTPCRVYACTTPIDDEFSDMFGTIFVEQDNAAEGAGRFVPVGRARKRIEEQTYQNQVDFNIWNHMVYLNRPAYSSLEGKLFRRVREWAEQFYPQGEPTPRITGAPRQTPPGNL